MKADFEIDFEGSVESLVRRIKEAVKNVQDDEKFWDSEAFIDLKREIKAYLKRKTRYCCAYCRKNLLGEHEMTIDVEHILEKDRFPRLTFEIHNLAASCRRCNFQKNRIEKPYEPDVESAYRSSHAYRFIHPNLDDYFDYMGVISISIDGLSVIKYMPMPRAGVPNPEKAWFTYDEFRLREIERLDLMSALKVHKPNSILAIESPEVREFLAQQLEASHGLKQQAKAQRSAARKRDRLAEKHARQAAPPKQVVRAKAVKAKKRGR